MPADRIATGRNKPGRGGSGLARQMAVGYSTACSDGNFQGSGLQPQIRPGMKVWQVAHVYGDLVRHVAARVGSTGEFHLTDIAPIQIQHGRNKLAAFPWARVIRADAGTYDSGTDYDLICSFFLLHEVPDEKKRQIVDHLLERLPPGGKALFVDYHRPAWWQPVRWVLKCINAWLEPFADGMWRHEIQDYASCPERFTWRKRTFFGDTYQIVWVERAR